MQSHKRSPNDSISRRISIEISTDAWAIEVVINSVHWRRTPQLPPKHKIFELLGERVSFLQIETWDEQEHYESHQKRMGVDKTLLIIAHSYQRHPIVTRLLSQHVMMKVTEQIVNSHHKLHNTFQFFAITTEICKPTTTSHAHQEMTHRRENKRKETCPWRMHSDFLQTCCCQSGINTFWHGCKTLCISAPYFFY